MWYKNFLDCYEKPYNNISKERIDACRKRIESLQSEAPIASVVIIAYNEQERLFACIESLGYTKCKYPIEIIGVDNNSKDLTAEIYKSCGIKYCLETKQGYGHARNCGLYAAKGKYYICIDADVIYPPNYIEKMVEKLSFNNNVCVNSRFSYISYNFNDKCKMFFYEKLRNIHYNLKAYNRPESIVRGFVFGFDRELGIKIGGFRTNILRGEDGSMALALKDYGKISFLKDNKCKPVTGLRALERDGSVFVAFKIRFIKELKNIKRYFYKKTKSECKDDESNLIK